MNLSKKRYLKFNEMGVEISLRNAPEETSKKRGFKNARFGIVLTASLEGESKVKKGNG
jgi:hypothetical protein